MSKFPLSFPPVGNSPKPTGVDPSSDAGKLEAALVAWARQVALAFQKGSVEVSVPEGESTTIVNETINNNGSGSSNPTGPAGGDLGGTYPDPSVQKIRGATPGDIVTHNAAEFALAGSSAPPNGPAGGALAGNYPNPDTNPAYDAVFNSVVASIVEAIRYNFPQVAVGPTSGAISIDLSANNRGYYQINGNSTFSFVTPADSQIYWLTIKNVAGVAKTLTWPAFTVANGVSVPTSLPAGATLALRFSVVAATTAGIIVTYAGTPFVSLGDLVFGGASGVSTILSGNTTARRKYLSQLGTGAVSAAPMWSDTDRLFNVADYGAVQNSSGSAAANVTAFNAARDAMLAAGGGTIYWPPGIWYINALLNVAPASNSIRFEIAGAGMQSTYIVQNTAGASGIECDLTNGGSTTIKNRAIVRDLALRTAVGIEAATAITMYYGESYGVINFRMNQNSGVLNVDIDSNDSESGGWDDGILMWGASAGFIRHVYIFGGSGWNTGSGAGMGNAIQIKGGINHLIEGVYAQSWDTAFALVPQDGIGGATLCPQGSTISDVVVVNAIKLFRSYKTSGGGTDGPDGFSFSNFLLDNGNTSDANHLAFYIEGATPSGYTIANGQILTNGGIDIFKLDGATNGKVSSVTMAQTGSAISGYALNMTGASNGNTFHGCSFNNLAINLGSGCGYNRINNTGSLSGSGGSTITDAGTNNVIGDSFGVSNTVALAGGAAYEEFNVNVTAGGYSNKTALGSTVQIVDGTGFQAYDAVVRPVAVTGSTTATNYVIRVFKRDGTNTGAVTLRYQFMCCP